MKIRKAKPSDKETILHLLDSGREIMRRNGNPLQWPDGYPNPETIDTDITQGVSYLCLEDGKAVGTFAMIPGPDPTYATIYQGRWIDNTLPYLVVHRMASLPDSHGIFRTCLEYVTTSVSIHTAITIFCSTTCRSTVLATAESST